MKLSEIETADIPVREMTITDSQITILYDEVYHIPTQSYIKNIQITITNWWELLVKIFLSPAPYIKPTEVICEGAQREVFDLIQEITFSDNTFTKEELESSTIAHELGHNMGLSHLFSKESEFYFYKGYTDNIMDYENRERFEVTGNTDKNKHKRKSFFKWQWDIIREQMEAL